MNGRFFLAKKGLFFRRGQSISEYMLLFGIVAVALVGMQVYMKRGIQAVIQVAAEQVGKQTDAEYYDAEKRTLPNSTFQTSSHSISKLATSAGGSLGKEFDISSETSGEARYVSEEEE